MRQYTIDILREEGLIVFEAIMGSRAYGTHLPTSDTDIRGVFIQPLEDILGFGYVEQVNDKLNDIVFYEIRRFLELVRSNNPNILELLNAPEDCILHKDPIFDLVLEQKEQFVTKQCKNSFAGYAIGQIKKARGYNKKINWEENEMVRKTVLDFCYVLEDGKTILLNEWIDLMNVGVDDEYHIDQRYMGLVNIEHAHDIYALYILTEDELNFENSGIVSDPDKASDVQLTSISKTTASLGSDAYLTFNKDAYSTHCKRYAEYKEWLDNRNEDRFKMNKEHGKNYDSKNMSHCIRLLDMGYEISKGKIIVRRSPKDIKILMSIRRGEMEYDDLLNLAEYKMKKMDEAWDKSRLPDKIDKNFIDNLLVTIRKLRYAKTI